MVKIFGTDPTQVKHARYVFVPKGKDGRDVFLPEKRVNKENLKTAICLDYFGPPPQSNNTRYKVHLFHESDDIVPPTGRHVPINDTFEQALTKEVIQLLNEARKYYNDMKSSNQ
jgi:hypothetical protein